MRIGLCGAHRTGKSTLARHIAADHGLDVVSSSVSSIAKEYGFNMDTDRRDDPSFFAMQLHILKSLEDSFQGSSFVSDRTPLDAAAYLLADVQANTGDDKWRDAVLQYQDKAVKLTDDLFDVVILLPPAISFEPMDGKPGDNLAYQEHHHLLCRGLMGELVTPHGEIERENMDLDDRLRSANDFIYGVERRRSLRRAMLAGNGKFDLDKALA